MSQEANLVARGKESICQCRRHSLDPCSEIPYAAEQLSCAPELLSQCARACEMQLSSPSAATTGEGDGTHSSPLLPGKSHGRRSLAGCSPRVAKCPTRLSDFTFNFHFRALEKEMATHSSVIARRIPGTGEPGGLPSLGSHRVRHN